jgi:hypothetical protein
VVACRKRREEIEIVPGEDPPVVRDVMFDKASNDSRRIREIE